MAKKRRKAIRKKTGGIEINRGLSNTGAWIVRSTLGNTQNVTVHADSLRVTETGCLIFLVSEVPTFVVPVGQYTDATRSGAEIRTAIKIQMAKTIADAFRRSGGYNPVI